MTSGRRTSFEAGIVLRPRTLNETLDLALAYLRVHFRDFARLSALLITPSFALLITLDLWLDLEWATIWAVVLVLSPLLERVVIVYGSRHLFGNSPRVFDAVAAALRRPFAAVFTAVVIPLPWLWMLAPLDESDPRVFFATLLGAVWFFVLGRTLYASIVLLLEGLPLMRRSSRDGRSPDRDHDRTVAERTRSLSRYRYGRALAFVFTSVSMRLLSAVCFELTAQFLITFLLQLGSPVDTLWENGGSWAAVLGWLAACPYLAVARLFDYVDARTRLEGWDIQVRFEACVAKAERERSAA